MNNRQKCQPCAQLFGADTPAEGEMVIVDEATGKVARVHCCRRCALELAKAIERHAVEGRAEGLSEAIQYLQNNQPRRTPSPTFPIEAKSDDEAVSRLLGDQTYNGEGC